MIKSDYFKQKLLLWPQAPFKEVKFCNEIMKKYFKKIFFMSEEDKKK